jgi:hypothetical protein
MEANRVGSNCWFKTFDIRTREHSDWRPGRLLNWSTDHVEYESGPGNFPVGVVEDSKDLSCHSVYVEFISFASNPEESGK